MSTETVSECGGQCTTVYDTSGPEPVMLVSISRGPKMKEIHRESYGVKWCFACRGRHEFVYVVKAPTEPSYYDPLPSIRCTNCDAANGDCGFGRYREWE